MKDLKKEELLDTLDTMLIRTVADIDEHDGKSDYAKELVEKVEQAYQQIKAIITKFDEECVKSFDTGYKAGVIERPKVTEEFIEKWADKFDGFAQQRLIIDIDLIKQMLKEAGYQIGVSVTEKWIEEKAKEFLVKTNISVQTPEAVKQQLKIIQDFIRSLIEKINGRK